MSLEITIPFGKLDGKDNVKNLVFSILTKEYPLKIIDLTNFIRKRYGKSVTFQAVRKALIQLVSDGVLIKEGTSFQINKNWVFESKKVLSDFISLGRLPALPGSIALCDRHADPKNERLLVF